MACFPKETRPKGFLKLRKLKLKTRRKLNLSFAVV
jgi:hypothetical protein